MDLREKFVAYIKQEKLFQRGDGLLLAISGGVDSAVLARLCSEEGYRFAVAHCNFQLRGSESLRDEEFSAKIAARYGAAFFSRRFDTIAEASKNKTGIEETARELRYAYFADILRQSIGSGCQYKYTLTAHHADDNIETLLMNFFRGTGVAGMRGILPKQQSVIRPLLFASGAEIESYAARHDISFVTDSSNADSVYTRNFFRNEIIPALQSRYPQVKQNLSANIARFTDVAVIYETAIHGIREKMLERRGAEVHIPVLKLAAAPARSTVIFEIIKDWGFGAAQVHEVEKLLPAMSGKYISSPTHRILKNRNWLIISPLAASPDETGVPVEKSTRQIILSNGELHFTTYPLPPAISTDADYAYVDAKLLAYPLLVRRPKKGDYFYPLGMKKKKKLSRFFGDLKMSLLQKEKLLVIESGRKIIWVIGCRIDDRFKLTASTKETLVIHHHQGGQTGLGA